MSKEKGIGYVETLFSTESIAGTAAGAFTSAMQMRYVSSFGVEIQCAGSAIAQQLGYQLSMDGVNFVVPESGGTVITSVTDSNRHIESVMPEPAAYIRFQVQGVTGNHADATATLKVYLF